MEAATSKSLPRFRLNSTMFLVGTLLFLLPFVNIRCGQNYISNNGIGLAFGINYKTSKEVESKTEDFNKKISVMEKDSGKMYVSALIALLLGVAGLILSVMNRGMDKITVIIGILAALTLVALMIQIKYDFKNETGHAMTNTVTDSSKWTVEFTVWYYLSLISFIAAAFFSYWRKPIVISN